LSAWPEFFGRQSPSGDERLANLIDGRCGFGVVSHLVCLHFSMGIRLKIAIGIVILWWLLMVARMVVG
jgi:hypothetical protein